MSSMKGFQDTIAWYDKHVKEFSKTRKSAGSVYDIFNDFEALLPAGGKILDAGCGVGRDTEMFMQHGFDVTGLDLSTGLIEEAKMQFPNGKFLVGDMRFLPFPDKDFDGVWANASLLHFENQEDVLRTLKEFFRVLKEHGMVYVAVKLQTGKEKMAFEEDERYDEPRFFQYFTSNEMHELLKEAGFTVVVSRIEQSKSRSKIQWIQVIGKRR